MDFPGSHGYAFSALGGAVLGGSLGAIGGSSSTIAKSMLLGSSSVSALYLHYHHGDEREENKKYLFTYSMFGVGLGWAATNSAKGAAIGGAATFGIVALTITLQP
ncbi:hypothetical protein ACOBR2_20775 [Telmatobacter bradus]|uniref:hypothetical protein n=1 Tax=Telmatobacter bradus TaxID=474953 RepID=UPI003B428CE0